MHDAIQFEAAGTPATVVITSPFTSLVDAVSETLGLPAYHSAAIPHPLFAQSGKALRRSAAGIIEQVADQLGLKA